MNKPIGHGYQQLRLFAQVALAFVMTSGGLLAAPYFGEAFTYRQPDGEAFQVHLYGDEFFSYQETSDGYLVVRDPKSGIFCYGKVTPDGSDIISTGVRVGQAKPAGLNPKQRLAANKAMEKSLRNRNLLGVDDKGRRNHGKKLFKGKNGEIVNVKLAEAPPQPSAGDQPAPEATAEPPPDSPPVAPAPPPAVTINQRVGLVLLASFPDRPADITKTVAQVDDYCNAETYTADGNATSIYGYFKMQSNGKLSYKNNVTAWFTAANPRSYYTDNTVAYATRARELIKEGLAVLKAKGFDFTQCDGDGNGKLDGVNIFYAGARTNAWSEGIWPHQSSSSWTGLTGTGLTTTSYDYQITDMPASLPIGTFCHENGHMICDFPDLYSYDGNAANMGAFSLMASSGSTHPRHVDPYLKIHAGWADVVDITSTSHLLGAVQQDRNFFYRYRNPARTTEYFIFEVRGTAGYEGLWNGAAATNPANGLVIYHAMQTGSNPNSTIFTADAVTNYTKPYELLVVESTPVAVAPWYDDPTPGTNDAFSSTGVSAISDITTPADLKFWAADGRTLASGANIHTISAAGQTMTFVAGAGALPATPVTNVTATAFQPNTDFGENAANQTFSVFNGGGGTLTYTVSDNVTWLACAPATSSTATTEADLITVSYTTNALAAGTHSATITIDGGAAGIKTIGVTLTVNPRPTLAATPASLAVAGITGTSGPNATFNLTNTGGGTVSYAITKTQAWLTLDRTSGSIEGEQDLVTATFNATSLAPGVYTDTITITAAEATNSPLLIPVSYTVGSTDMILTSPNGGETWYINNTKAITWASSLGGTVKIELFKAGALHTTIAASAPNTGTYNWTLPGTLTLASDYKIKITINPSGASDESFTNFTIAEDLLAVALDTTGLTWSTTAPAWFRTTTVANTHDGVDAAESANITHGEATTMETTIVGPGTMTFWWKVSSELNYDFLRFYLNGVEQTGSLAKISGPTVAWAQKTVTIPAGSNVVKWGYSKDTSADAGSDTAWVDQVVFTPDAQPEIAVEDHGSTGLTDGGSTDNFGPTNTTGGTVVRNFTIRNVGTADLTVSAINKSGTNSADYTVGALSSNLLIPNATATFNVTFDPSADGVRTAAIQIASDDANENPFDINLTGTGIGPGTLVVTGAGGLTSSGTYAGPFTPSSIDYTLSNPGNSTITWTAAKTQSWVTLSSAGGTLVAGATTIVTASINTGANTLGVGSYSDTISFTSSTTGNTTRGVSLTVNPIAATVSLSNLLQTYNGSPKPVTVTTTPGGLTHSVTYAGSGTVPTNAGTYAVVATITQANYTGSASGSLTIQKAAQTITFGALSPVLDTATPFALGGTSSSGLAIAYTSSNTAVATVSGNTVTIVGLGSTTITAAQAGDANYNAATSVPQTLTVNRANPLAVTGGPYKVLVGQSLSLNGSGSFPSYGETISSYQWDLNRDDVFGDVIGANPLAIDFNTLMSSYGMVQGLNAIKLKITDTSNKTSIVASTVELVSALNWDANGTTAGQTNGGGAWLGANLWWDGAANQSWASGSNASFGGPSTAGGIVTLASPTSVNAITFNTHTGTYTLGTAGQTLTINGGINKTSTSAVAVINSPVVLGAAQTWTNSASGTNSLSMGGNGTGAPVDNGGNLLTIDGVGSTYLKWAAISGGGGLTKNGTGFLELGGQYTGAAMYHTYTGTTTLNGGTMRVVGDSGSNGNLGSGNLTLNGGVLEYYFSGSFIRTLGADVGQVQILGGTSGFGFGSSGTVTLNNNAAFEAVWGSAYFNPSTLVLNPPTSVGTITFANKIDLSASTRTIQTSAGTARISGIIRTSTGTAGLTKTGAGILALDAANTFTGNITISGGTLRVGNNSAGTLASGSYAGNISIASGATLQVWSTAAQTLSGTISGAGALQKAYVGALTLSGPNTYTGKTSFLPQTTSGFTVNITSFNSVNGGSPLMASSSLGAPTTIANGTIDIGDGGRQASVILNYTGAGETTDRILNFGFNGTSSQTISASGSGLLKFTSAMTSNAVAQAGQLILSGTGSGEITQALPALPTGGLAKTGAGTWTLSAVNTYVGPTTITLGKLALGANNALPDASAVTIAGATLDAATFSDTVGTLAVTGAATINLGSGAALAFADSSLVAWTGATLNLTGTFVSGASLRFGTTNTALTSVQLAKFTGTGLSSFALNGNGYLTAVGGGGDTTPPTLVGIVDDKGGSGITAGTLVTYTVTFSEDMDATTVTAADFGNAGTSTVSIGTVTETTPGVFTVQATPSTAGSLILRVNQSAVLTDMAGNSLNTGTAIADNTTITVTGGDVTAPTLASSAIVDNKSGNPVTVSTLVTYTVTFSEDMDASTVAADDFGNAGSSAVTIGAVAETTPGVFTVQATPTTEGTLILRVNAAAVLKDVAGNNLNTTSAIADNTSITVDGTLPTLTGLNIVDNKSGGRIMVDTLVTYTVTFSEDMDASTVAADDFGNAGGATVTIGTVTETTPGVFTVQATPTTAGTLTLRVNAAAVLKDVAGNNLNTSSAIVDNTTIVVDGDVPTLAGTNMVDNKSGNPVTVNMLVTYTVTFSEDMDASTVTAADFGNAGASSVTIGTVIETSPGVFSVQATPTTAGTLQLKINAAAVLKDVAGNSLDTTSQIDDDTTITVDGDVPTLASANIVDNKSGNPVNVNTLVTYTVTFSEDMDASTITAADFGNAGTSAVTIGTIAETTTTSGIFTVQATPTTAGTLQLKINATAEVKDVAGNSLDTTAAISDDTTITVNPITVTLTYNGNGSTGGAAPTSSNYSFNTTATVAGAGTLLKTGYTFAGWNTIAVGGGTSYAPTNTFTITSDVTLYAQWTINTYAVTYNANNPTTGTAPANQIKTYGVNLPLQTNSGALTKTGYTFAGWNTAAGGGGTDYAEGEVYTGNAALTLYAKWTLITYAVTYNANSASSGSAPANQTKTYGVSLTLQANTGSLARVGYTFAGWNTAADGTGTSYAESASYTANAALPLYAKWTANPYTVTFNANGGQTPVPASKVVTFDSVYGTLAATSRTGYLFNGWFTALTGGSQVTNETLVTTAADHTLHARWTPIFPEMDVTRLAAVDVGSYDQVSATIATADTKLTYDISNSGSDALTLANAVISATNNCTITIDSQPALSLSPLGSSNLIINLNPDAAGAWSFRVSIANNDPDENPYQWTVHGVAQTSTTVSLVPVADTYIDDQATTANYGGAGTMGLSNRPSNPNKSVLRGLMRFTLPAIPATADLTATLNFVQDNANSGLVSIFGVTGAWSELGTDPVMASATWANSSTLFGATSFGSVTTSTSAGAVSTISLNPAGITKLREWVATPATNYGFGLTTTYNIRNNSLSLRTREDLTTANRPTLTITYTENPQVAEMEVARAATVVANAGTDVLPGTIAGTVTPFTYTIANLGNVNLTLPTPVTVSAQSNCTVTVSSQPGNTVTPSAETSMVITVTPTLAGAWSASLSIDSNDPNEATYNWTISGTALSRSAAWVNSTFANGTLANKDMASDPDGDGLATGVEWVLGLDPSLANDAAGKKPTFDLTTDPAYFTYRYRRTDAAKADPQTNMVVQYGSNLSGWITAAPDGTNIIITESNDTHGTGVDEVVVKIKRSFAASNGKLFSRLYVVVTP